MANTTTTQIPPALQDYYDRRLLARAIPALVHQRFGQQRPIRTRSGNQIKFRRYDALAAATTPLTEGITPAGSQLAKTDITATLAQYGDFVTLTDLVQFVNEDPVLSEAGKVLGEQSGDTIDQIVRNILVAGTNVSYANGTARTAVNTAITATLLNTAIRTLKRQKAKRIKEQINAEKGIGTVPIRAAFIAICHPDTTADLENITGYTAAANYGNNSSVMDDEMGAYKEIRFIESTNAKIWADAGGAKGAMISTTGTSADVYATLIVAQDAYGVVPLAGKAMENIITQLGSAGAADPLKQRGTSAWKATTTAKILNENWMVRIEHACSETP